MTRQPFRHLSTQVLPLLLLAATGQASADRLLVERAQQTPAMALPTRGMPMQDVQARFGAPAQRLEPRGGQKRQWPTIHRWSYPEFTVYFENNRVIDAVVTQADATEAGPKPPIR